MMEVKLTARARTDLIDIAEYIKQDDPLAAIALTDKILAGIHGQLPPNPKIGRVGRVSGTRELVVHSSYIAVYRIQQDAIEILTVRHTAQLWPLSF